MIPIGEEVINFPQQHEADSIYWFCWNTLHTDLSAGPFIRKKQTNVIDMVN